MGEMQRDIERIQRWVNRGDVLLTFHGAQEARTEAILASEIIETIAGGTILEDYSDDRTEMALLEYAFRKRPAMKCDLCGGEYHKKLTVFSFRRQGTSVVVEDVPALVCDRCGDKLMYGSTLRTAEELLDDEPQGTAPLYRFPDAEVAASR